MKTNYISGMPKLSTSWIKVGRKYYNLENAIIIEVSMDDIVVTFSGQETADIIWNEATKQFIEKVIPIQITFEGYAAAIICEWIESRSTSIEGKRITFISGYINEQNRR